MRTFRTAAGPFQERPYFKDAEIERMCVDALRAVNLLPTSPEAIRVDRFIEKKFGVAPKYEDLPGGLLGLTIFTDGKVADVIVARALDTDATTMAERRIRSTLAHEAGHGLMHAHLFAVETSGTPLFGDFSEPTKPRVLCREDGSSSPRQYTGEWWEFQANKAIGALLLPRQLVDQAVEKFLTETAMGLKVFDHSRSETAARELADIFDVNPAVARIRLDQLYSRDSSTQLTL